MERNLREGDREAVIINGPAENPMLANNLNLILDFCSADTFEILFHEKRDIETDFIKSGSL